MVSLKEGPILMLQKKMFWTLLFSFIYFCIRVHSTDSLFGPKTIRFHKFEGICPEYKHPLIYLTDIRITTIERTFYVNMNINVTGTLKEGEGTQLHIYLKRCFSRDDLNSCETLNTIKVKKFCHFLEGDNKPWSPFRKVMDPPIGGCPFKKGIFKIQNGTFDGSKFSNLPVSDWYWRIRAQLINDVTEEVLLCVLVEGQIAPA